MNNNPTRRGRSSAEGRESKHPVSGARFRGFGWEGEFGGACSSEGLSSSGRDREEVPGGRTLMSIGAPVSLCVQVEHVTNMGALGGRSLRRCSTRGVREGRFDGVVAAQPNVAINRSST